MKSRKEIHKLLEPLFDDRRLEMYPPPSSTRDEVIIELLLDIRDHIVELRSGK